MRILFVNYFLFFISLLSSVALAGKESKSSSSAPIKRFKYCPYQPPSAGSKNSKGQKQPLPLMQTPSASSVPAVSEGSSASNAFFLPSHEVSPLPLLASNRPISQFFPTPPHYFPTASFPPQEGEALPWPHGQETVVIQPQQEQNWHTLVIDPSDPGTALQRVCEVLLTRDGGPAAIFQFCQSYVEHIVSGGSQVPAGVSSLPLHHEAVPPPPVPFASTTQPDPSDTTTSDAPSLFEVNLYHPATPQEIEKVLQDWRNFIQAHPKGHAVTLCFSNVEALQNAVNDLDLQPDLLASIKYLKLHNFTDTLVGKNIGILIKFLQPISPTLTKISFINFVVSRRNIDNFSGAIKLLNNIVELEFINTQVRPGLFSKLLKIATHLKNLTHLNFDGLCLRHIVYPNQIRYEVAFQESRLPVLHTTIEEFIQQNRDLKLEVLNFSRIHFEISDDVIDYFIGKIIELKTFPFLKELNMSRTKISSDSIIELLNVLIAQPEFLPCLKKLYIPDVDSNDSKKIPALINTLQQNRDLSVYQDKQQHI